MQPAKQIFERDELFRILGECALDGMIFHESGSAIHANMNCLDMTGYTREDFIGRNVFELLIAPDYKEFTLGKIRDGYPQAYESLIVRKDGSLLPVLLKGRAIGSQDNTLRVEVIRDLSAARSMDQCLRDTREQTAASSRLKDQFVALISHDLRSPLVSIKGMLDIAKEESAEGLFEMSRNGMFERIAGSAEGLIVLIERLLDHSRLQTGEIKPDSRFVNVGSLVDARISRISHLASMKNVSINNYLPDAMNIYADPDLYGEVLHNVISNAIKFTPRGGHVTVLSPDDSTVIVRDNGIGIDERIFPDLFKDGVRTSTYGTEGEKGTGLGLPYSYNIMKAHGGDLMAKSALGQGTEIHIILPKHTSIVLLVSDEDGQRSMIKEMIASFGKVLVVEARNGAEALNQLRYFMPTIVITDIEMPVFDGIELTRWIRSSPQYELVPIMALAAGMDADHGDLRENLSSLGADDILSKPLVENDFLPVVARYLGIV